MPKNPGKRRTQNSPAERLHQRILFEALRDSWRPIGQIAEGAGARAHSVQHTLSRLKQRNVIQPFALINPHTLGLTDYCVFLNLRSSNGRPCRLAFLKFCATAPGVAYLAEHTGGFHFSVSLFAGSVFDVERFFDRLYRAIPGVRVERSVAVRARWLSLARRYLLSGPAQFGSQSPIEFVREWVPGSPIEQLDGLDRRLLGALAQSPSSPVLQIARMVGVAESTARARINTLIQRRILIGVPYWLHAREIGRHCFRLLIGCDGVSKQMEASLLSFAHSTSGVVQFVRCFGAWDFELNLECEAPEEVNGIADQLATMFPHAVRQLRTLSEIKVHLINQFPFQEEGLPK